MSNLSFNFGQTDLEIQRIFFKKTKNVLFLAIKVIWLEVCCELVLPGQHLLADILTVQANCKSGINVILIHFWRTYKVELLKKTRQMMEKEPCFRPCNELFASCNFQYFIFLCVKRFFQHSNF